MSPQRPAIDAQRLKANLEKLMMTPGLSGYEGRVRSQIRAMLKAEGLSARTDSMGNLIVELEGNSDSPRVMLVAHMDQLGLIVRAIDPSGYVRVERLGGVPERTLASQEVLFQIGEGRDLPGVIANKSHHATSAEEKYVVVRYRDVFIDLGMESAAAVRDAGIEIGSPIVYRPRVVDMGSNRIAGTAIDDRAGCAVLIEVISHFAQSKDRPTVQAVFSVQEEFNLRGALVAAQTLKPDIALQIDLMLATDSPDMRGYGEMALGGGPAIGLYSFHGRGTLNGTIAHPALVRLFETAAHTRQIPLQRSAQVGILTETAYLQLFGEGVAAIDVGFPCRYTHSSLEVCDLRDLNALANLLVTAIAGIGPDFSLNRDDFEQ